MRSQLLQTSHFTINDGTAISSISPQLHGLFPGDPYKTSFGINHVQKKPMYWKCIGNVLEMYWKCIGNVGTWKNGKSFLSFISYICLFH